MAAIGEICAKLEALLCSRQGMEQKIEGAVNALSRIFGVERSEVAIFGLDTKLDCFNFLWPPEMRKAGSIPFSANRSLVSTTAAERRCFLDNSFSSTPHLFVFESYVKDKPASIQKIMSAPLLDGDDLKGVLQVSRKGDDMDTSIKNFTDPELAALGELAKVIARHL